MFVSFFQSDALPLFSISSLFFASAYLFVSLPQRCSNLRVAIPLPGCSCRFGAIPLLRRSCHIVANPQQSPSQQNSALASHTLSLPCRRRAFSSMPLRFVVAPRYAIAILCKSIQAFALPVVSHRRHAAAFPCSAPASPPIALPQRRSYLLILCYAFPLRCRAHLRLSTPFLRQPPLFFALALRRPSAQSRRISLPSISSPCRCLSLLRSSVAEQPVLRPSIALIFHAFPLHRHAVRADPSLSNAGQSPCESSQYSAVAPGHLYRQGSSRPFCPGYTVCRMQTAPSSLISRYR